MLRLVHDKDQDPLPILPPAGGDLAHLPGPAVWISNSGRVIDANLAAMEVMLDMGEAGAPLRDAIVATLSDHLPRQAKVTLVGKSYVFQFAISVSPDQLQEPCVIAIGQVVEPEPDSAADKT